MTVVSTAGEWKVEEVVVQDHSSDNDNNGLINSLIFSPHTISVLLTILGTFLYLSIYKSPSQSMVSNSINGILASCVVFVFFGITQLKDGPFVRPHPAIWRAVQAVTIIYLMMLIFLFFQNVSDARQLLKHLDSSLGVPLPEQSYGDHCSLCLENIWNQIDIFVIAHVLGWYVKALMLRDNWLLWILSIMFEVMEYSLEHQLPNFGECWWDHWVLDVLICNWAGIWFGMKTCQYFSMKKYNWRNIADFPKLSGKMGRALGQFTPHHYTVFNWAASESFRGYCAVVILIALFLESELNAFYLKSLLWLPVPHPFNFCRLLLHALGGSVAIKEAYQYANSPIIKGVKTRLGTQCWIMIAVVVIESLICVKFGHDQYPAPAPWYVKMFWVFFLIGLVLFPTFKFFLLPRWYSGDLSSKKKVVRGRTSSHSPSKKILKEEKKKIRSKSKAKKSRSKSKTPKA